MIKTYNEIATTIRANAKKILEEKNIESTVKMMGDLFYTGSYALDLMTWNDIDMQVVLKKGFDPIESFGVLLNQISKDSGFIESQMIHFKGNYKPKMPRGVYLGIKLDCPKNGGIWKLDFWSLEQLDFEKNRSLIEALKTKLDSKTRDLILELKHEMMSGSDRVPQMGSHFLYQAILLEGIKEKEAIYKYLENLGLGIRK